MLFGRQAMNAVVSLNIPVNFYGVM